MFSTLKEPRKPAHLVYLPRDHFPDGEMQPALLWNRGITGCQAHYAAMCGEGNEG